MRDTLFQNGCQDGPLIERFREGNGSAFEELFIKYQSKVFSTCYRMLGNYQDASDMAQEVFIRAHKSLRRFRGDSRFYTWLYRITINSCINKLKSQKPILSLNDYNISQQHLRQTSGPSPDRNPVKRLEDKELQRYVQNGINSLSDKYRSAIVLRDIQGLRYQEIAAVLGCSLEAIRSCLYRARQELRKELKDIMPFMINGAKKKEK